MVNFFREKITRRDFVKKSCQFLPPLFFSAPLLSFLLEEAETKEEVLREAMFYKKLEKGVIECEVCFRGCVLRKGERSFCRNKVNREGKFYNLVYAKPSAVHIDPVGKEPQFHLLPGSSILCFGTAGCNFRCRFCQNWHLSQRSIEEMDYSHIPPEEAVEFALRKKVPTISFTYNEPTSFYEYVYDIARIAKKKGLRILWHSNGSMNPKPLKEMLKYTDAVTIDLKGFTKEFYENVSSAELEPVLRTLKIIREEKVWLEIVNLVVPTLNDNPDDTRRMCLWIRENLGKDVPLHFTRFFPAYKLTNLNPTPIETLERAYRIAKDVGLEYVYIGNVPGHKYNSTFCSRCGKNIIQRTHFSTGEQNIKDGKCKFCGNPIPGIWT